MIAFTRIIWVLVMGCVLVRKCSLDTPAPAIAPTVETHHGYLRDGLWIQDNKVYGAPEFAPVIEDNTITRTMSEGEMEARATELTGRMMLCFGDNTGRQCRPVGYSQTEHPDLIIGPLVVCYDGRCQRVGAK